LIHRGTLRSPATEIIMIRMLFTLVLGTMGLVCALLGGRLVQLSALEPPPRPAAVKLPLTRVVLTNAGVGYFRRQGTIDGTGQLTLRVDEDDVSDLILTLQADDPKGKAAQIAYDTRTPAEITLRSFRVDLVDNPGLGGLLAQARGERVEIRFESKPDQMTSTVGSIVSVVRPQATSVAAPGEDAKAVVVPPRKDEVELLNLLTDDGLTAIAMSKIRNVKLMNEDLQADFKRALQAFAALHSDGRKSVAVTFRGEGARPVSVDYVAEAPIWKPTYRLNLTPPRGQQFGNLGGQFGIAGGGQRLGDAVPPQPGPGGIAGGINPVMAEMARLQGFAAIENTTDDDWQNVSMKLISSRPITFRMDLYDPLFIPRPTVEAGIYASLRPTIYQGSNTQAGFGGGFGGLGQQGMTQPGSNQGAGILGGNGIAANLGSGGGVAGHAYSGYALRGSARSYLRNRLSFQELRERKANPAGEADAHDPVAAAGSDLGESFDYTIAEPVSLARHQSALVPLFHEPINVTRISIYNPATLAKYPLHGLQIKNASRFHIAQGPVTISDGDSMLGQARLPDVKPGESRLLSYAIDLDVAMKSSHPDELRTTLALSIADGKLSRTTRVRMTTRTHAQNRSRDLRTIWITHPIRPGHRLVSPAKPAETTAHLYRFELIVAANATATLDVIEEQNLTDVIPLESVTPSMIDAESNSPTTTPAMKEVLAKIKTALIERATAAAAIESARAVIKSIRAEQPPQRENLSALPADSSAHRRLVKKFDDQETEIEAFEIRIKALEEKRAALLAGITAINAESKASP
jgi:hypothetical protein